MDNFMCHKPSMAFLARTEILTRIEMRRILGHVFSDGSCHGQAQVAVNVILHTAMEAALRSMFSGMPMASGICPP